jgi:hypothetical protein
LNTVSGSAVEAARITHTDSPGDPPTPMQPVGTSLRNWTCADTR